MSALAALLALCLASLLLPSYAKRLSNLLQSRREGSTVYYDMVVTLGKASPDCHTRDVILVNGQFQPVMEVRVNDTLVVNVHNKLPADFPQLTGGISIHWHGFDMWNNATWYDGTSYVTMCPIAIGKNFTYNFFVDEAPGTYLWHDHSGLNRVDGLQGPLIVRPNGTLRAPYDPIHEDRLLFLTDWYHTQSAAIAMPLNRPLGSRMQSNDSGSFESVGSPQSILINGKGHSKVCNMSVDAMVVGANGYAQPTCNVTRMVEPKQSGSLGCRHATFDVEYNKRYYFRIINAAAQSFFTVCFEGFQVLIVTADTTPTEQIPTSCVDVNTGQRYDVVLRTGPKPKSGPPINYWISVSTQYQSSAPAAYAVLRFSSKGSTGGLPLTPTPQPGVPPWSPTFSRYVSTNEGVLGYVDNYELQLFWKSFLHGTSYGSGILRAPAAKTITLNTSSPSMVESGVPRWAMNNVVASVAPPCTSMMRDMLQEPGWIKKHTVETDLASVLAHNAALMNKTDAGKLPINVYVDGKPPPTIPALGIAIIELPFDGIIDVIINNVPTQDGSGINGRGTEQHPFHMHGHRFWIMGTGPGVWDHDRDEPSLNLYNPLLRDTITLMSNSWAYIRFRASNPGVWPFHCHIAWHEFMGQKVFFVEAAERIPPPPEGMPECPASCQNKINPYTKSYVAEKYPNSTYDLP